MDLRYLYDLIVRDGLHTLCDDAFEELVEQLDSEQAHIDNDDIMGSHDDFAHQRWMLRKMTDVVMAEAAARQSRKEIQAEMARSCRASIMPPLIDKLQKAIIQARRGDVEAAEATFRAWRPHGISPEQREALAQLDSYLRLPGESSPATLAAYLHHLKKQY